MQPVTSPIPTTAWRTLIGALCLAGAAAPAGLLASGTRVGFKDTFAMARGNAFVATADNPSAIYYNPAGLTHLGGEQVSLSVYDVALTSHYSGTGGTAELDDSYQAVPQLFLTCNPDGTPWAYGFGVYAPFGLSTEWPASSPLRTFALKNEQTYLTFNLSAAYQVSPALSLGGGLTYNRVSTDLRRALGVFGPTDLFRFKGDGNTVGYTLGALWQPATQHSFGLSYQGRTRVKMQGTTDTIPLVAGEPSDATFDFPDVLILGYSYRPTPQWNLEVNLDWTNWDLLNTVTVNKASGATALPFNWQSGFFYEFGATRYLSDAWSVSAGYVYTENSTPDSTYTPAVPDSSRSFYSLGLGYKAGAYSANLAWHHADGGRRRVTGSPADLLGNTTDGTYDNTLDAFSLSLEWRF